jgi:hypothetical protein
MTVCLSDRALWAAADGSGAAEERAHLAACTTCAGRARRLAGDIALLADVLGDPPPRLARAASPIRLVRVALVTAVVMVALGIGMLRQPRDVDTPADADGVETLSDLGQGIFDDAETLVTSSDTDDLAVAYEEAAACEWEPGGCRDIGQPLF